jgi:hypothetical protein
VRITLGNFPKGARVTRAAVRLADGWLTLPEETEGDWPLARPPRELRRDPERENPPPPSPPLGEERDGRWAATFPRAGISAEEPRAWSPAISGQSARLFSGTRSVTDSPGPLLDMPGPSERTGAMGALAATGRYAVVHLKVEGWPADFALSWPAEYAHTRILRLAVPLEDR